MSTKKTNAICFFSRSKHRTTGFIFVHTVLFLYILDRWQRRTWNFFTPNIMATSIRPNKKYANDTVHLPFTILRHKKNDDPIWWEKNSLATTIERYTGTEVDEKNAKRNIYCLLRTDRTVRLQCNDFCIETNPLNGYFLRKETTYKTPPLHK